jgi:hypothetical protein
VKDRPIRQAIVLAAITFQLWGEPTSAIAQDEIDLMLRRGQIPADMTQRHGYSVLHRSTWAVPGSARGGGVRRSKIDSAGRLCDLAGDAAEFAIDREILGVEHRDQPRYAMCSPPMPALKLGRWSAQSVGHGSINRGNAEPHEVILVQCVASGT